MIVPKPSIENSSKDSKSEEDSSKKSKQDNKIHQNPKDKDQNPHISFKRVIEDRQLPLLAQERINLIDFPKLERIRTAERVINLQEKGNYELTFTALTLAPQAGLTSANPILEVIINDKVHNLDVLHS